MNRDGAVSLLMRVRGITHMAAGHCDRWLTPVFDLAIRLYVAEAFFRAGVLKLLDWQNTVDLFRYVYEVPCLSPVVAALTSTVGELVFPVLLAFGLGGRIAAGGLFVMNLVAGLSFPDISDLGLQDHVLWGVLLAVTVFHGPGRCSMDGWMANRWPSLKPGK